MSHNGQYNEGTDSQLLLLEEIFSRACQSLHSLKGLPFDSRFNLRLRDDTCSVGSMALTYTVVYFFFN